MEEDFSNCFSEDKDNRSKRFKVVDFKKRQNQKEVSAREQVMQKRLQQSMKDRGIQDEDDDDDQKIQGSNGDFLQNQKKTKKQDGLFKRVTKEEKKKMYEEDIQACSPSKKK